ncbi:uridine diphosphate-N-acetylglucosamine-binding protein YvcK [Vibrio sp.]|nr:uridine diphosphate-N-acetylglucosamine-binding protein YvcK [Vibrio sp.]
MNKKIVAIGGGHGLGRVLSALKDHGTNVTGIVTTTDNGGSTGRIRETRGGIAWGDTRNCINQLITDPTIPSMIFEYRFRGHGELEGHNLGNLILTALDDLSVRPLKAIELIRDLLQVDVNIVPMSEHPADLTGITKTGKSIYGETSVDASEEALLHLDLSPNIPATEEAVTAVSCADIIILGPGSFLTSVMPPLLLKGISQAIARNKKAKLLFIQNLAPEYGPAGKMTFEEEINWCENACHGRKIDLIIGEKVPSKQLQIQFVEKPLASSGRRWRHDREKLREALNEIIFEPETLAH